MAVDCESLTIARFFQQAYMDGDCSNRDVAVLLPVIGRLSNIRGRRKSLIAGNVVSLVGCAVVPLTHNKSL